MATVRISGVKWEETVEVQPGELGVLLVIKTQAGRFFRSTSFDMTRDEARRIADALHEAAGGT
jgi:hypothetical protein